ncbi:GTP-binding protein, partial [Klebsiella pneumoniae]|nr:GTP-binding protein [Klebsiella pneumoniae]
GDQALGGRLQLDGIVTTGDAKQGAAQLARHEESRQQVAVADRLLLTKAELVDAPALAELEAALEALNPGATRIPARNQGRNARGVRISSSCCASISPLR